MKCGATALFVFFSLNVLHVLRIQQNPILLANAFSARISTFLTTRQKIQKANSLRSKWDDLEDDFYDEDEAPPPFPIPRDMVYSEWNLKRQANNFEKISSIGDADLVSDVYVRCPGEEACWFIGKIVRVSDVTLYQAVLRQWSLIVNHARQLLPTVFADTSVWPQIWTAPADSQFEVASNDAKLALLEMNMEVIYAQYKDKVVQNTMVGFRGEEFGGGIAGFRTHRDEDGKPTDPEIKNTVLQEIIDDDEGLLPREINRRVLAKDDDLTNEANEEVEGYRENVLDAEELGKYLKKEAEEKEKQQQQLPQQQESTNATASSNVPPPKNISDNLSNMMNQPLSSSGKLPNLNKEWGEWDWLKD
mmetsp:Transcript_27446/g.41559  ORF Transcript_27446/g.41559 Transcript_27446/m.41559 type:complete len:361 (+) Transcript_27446:94-1176(+)